MIAVIIKDYSDFFGSFPKFMSNKNPIGIFDSGLGGLTVFREIERALPYEDIVYFGDTARLPYGSKSKDTIMRFSTENILFLLKKKVKLVVVACNTSSSFALDYFKNIFTVPVLGVIKAGVDKALKLSKTQRIGVIATKSTIASARYKKELLDCDKNVIVYSKACPLFVPLVEEGVFTGKIVDGAVNMYLKSLKGKVDTLILGCTHYPLLKTAISGYLKGVYLIDSAKEVSLRVRMILEENNLLNNTKRKPKKEFYVTDKPREFMKSAKIFLKKEISRPKVVNV